MLEGLPGFKSHRPAPVAVIGGFELRRGLQAAGVDGVDGYAAESEGVNQVVGIVFEDGEVVFEGFAERSAEGVGLVRRGNCAGEPDEALAAWKSGQVAAHHLKAAAQNLHAGAAIFVARSADGAEQGRHVALAVGGFVEQLRIGREPLNEAHVRVDLEQRDGRAGLQVLEAVDELLAQFHLRLNACVEGVDQNNRGGVGVGHGREVGKGVGRQRGCGFQRGQLRGAHGVVLFKMAEALRIAFLGDGEVGGSEAGDGLAGLIGDDDVEKDFAGGDGEGGGWARLG